MNAPVAVDDPTRWAEDTLLSIAAPGVLLNDTDVDGYALSAVVVPSLPRRGADFECQRLV